MKKLFRLLCFVLLLGLVLQPSPATAETILVTDDVTVARKWDTGDYGYTYLDDAGDWRMTTYYYYQQGYRNYQYYSYLQFDLSSIPDDYNLSSAALRLYLFRGSTQSPYVYHISDYLWDPDSQEESDEIWDEDTIHWNTVPATDGLIAQQGEVDWGYNPFNQWVEIPLINWDYQADLADDILSIKLSPYVVNNSGDTIEYATLNYSSGQFAATLELTGQSAAIPEPATMLLLGSGLIGLAGLRRKKVQN